MGRTLIITNDFPARRGGIETFVYALACRFPNDELVVMTSSNGPEDLDFDSGLDFPVYRTLEKVMLPTPGTARKAARLIERWDCDSVWFGAAAPLGLMAKWLRNHTSAKRFVATSHGHELWWSRIPVTRQLLRAIGNNVDHLTYISEYVRDRISRALSPAAVERLRRLAPGVEVERYSDLASGFEIRQRLGVGNRPMVLCVGRLVERKGQDRLIEAWPSVTSKVPDAMLVLAGGGPYLAKLKEMARASAAASSIVLAGRVSEDELPLLYGTADVFAGPSRNRHRDLEVEGLGIVYLEAASARTPVIVGDSGGAPEAVRDGETGYVVDGNDIEDLAEKLVRILGNPEQAASMGNAGRAWMEKEWTWNQRYQTLRELLGAE